MKLKDVLKRFLKSTPFYKLRIRRIKAKRTRQIDYIGRYFKIENEEMLHSFCDALNHAGLKFWLEFGTLLGYYREHDFIAHDLDIDTGTYYENASSVQTALEKAGFKLVREYKVMDDGGLEQCYLYKHITIDVFYFRRDKDTMYCNSFMSYDDKIDLSKRKYVNKACPVRVKRVDVPLMDYVPAKFKGCDVYVPEDTDRYLRMHYGNDYMTPNPKFDSRKEATNITYYEYEEKRGEAVFRLPYFGHPEDYGLI